MSMSGVNLGQFEADVGGKVDFGLSPQADIFVSYDGKFRGGEATHAASLGLQVAW